MNNFTVENAFHYAIENNGVTFNESNINPSNGFMVSFQGNERTFNRDEFTLEALQAHVDECAEFLNISENNFIGVWFNPEDGLYYLDLSENIQDKESAIRTGMNRDQLAIFDNKNLDVINLPERQKSGTMRQQQTYMSIKVRELL